MDAIEVIKQLCEEIEELKKGIEIDRQIGWKIKRETILLLEIVDDGENMEYIERIKRAKSIVNSLWADEESYSDLRSYLSKTVRGRELLEQFDRREK